VDGQWRRRLSLTSLKVMIEVIEMKSDIHVEGFRPRPADLLPFRNKIKRKNRLTSAKQSYSTSVFGTFFLTSSRNLVNHANRPSLRGLVTIRLLSTRSAQAHLWVLSLWTGKTDSVFIDLLNYGACQRVVGLLVFDLMCSSDSSCEERIIAKDYILVGRQFNENRETKYWVTIANRKRKRKKR